MFNVRGVNVFPTAVRAVVDAHPELLSGQFRIVLAGPGPYDRIVLRAEASATLADDAHAAAAAVVEQAIRRQLGASAAIEMLRFGSIARTDHKTSWIERVP
jgi:phenylacetate-CoA ligase